MTPEWSPRDFADTRAAWEGPLADRPDLRVRIEAAAYRGRPVSMLMVGPWSRPRAMEPLARSTAQTVLIGAGDARHRRARDRRHAARALQRARQARRRARSVAARAVLMVGYAAAWVLAAHHVPDVNQEMNSFFEELRQRAGGRRRCCG